MYYALGSYNHDGQFSSVKPSEIHNPSTSTEIGRSSGPAHPPVLRAGARVRALHRLPGRAGRGRRGPAAVGRRRQPGAPRQIRAPNAARVVFLSEIPDLSIESLDES